MEAVQRREVLAKDGEMILTGLPYRKGDAVEVIVFQPEAAASGEPLTVGRFLRSGLVGLWQDRDDIEDASAYARRLRAQAQNRGDDAHDPA